MMLLKGEGKDVKAQGKHFLIVNLAMEKKSGEDCDRSGLSITWPRTSILTGFMR